MAQPWSADEARKLHAIAQQMLVRHDHNPSDRDPLTRENCGACVLNGYRPRGGYGDPEMDAPGAGPNYAGWARIYVEAGRPIPAKWRRAFEEQLHSDNSAYSRALERSIATFVVRFTDSGKPLTHAAWGMSRRRAPAKSKNAPAHHHTHGRR